MNIIMALMPTESADTEKHVVNLSDELMHRGHNVYILSDSLNRDRESEHILFSFEYSGMMGRFRKARALRQFIDDIDIDLVHAHAADRAVYRACRKASIPLITTLHDLGVIPPHRKMLSVCGKKTLAAWEYIKTRAVGDGITGSDRIEIIHLGIDPDYFAPRAFKRAASRPVVSLVGDLTGIGGDIALKMMQESFEYDKYNVRVLGADYLPAEFSEFENNVVLIGSNEDTRPHLADSDVVIASGSSAVEALMMGRPLVAVGTARSIGLIDEDNIAEAVACAFGEFDQDNRPRHNYEAIQRDIARGIAQKYASDAVHEIIIREFSLKNVADRIEKIYNEVIGSKKK